MLCPLKFSHYEFEGGQDCIGSECGMHKLCNANDALAAENDVSEASVDANDSHVKLEEDWTEFYTTHERECLYQSDVGQFVFDLLDRQAAITERHWMEIVGASANANVELKRQIDELQAKVDELTAERDKLRDKVRHQSRQLTDTQNALENRNEEIKPRWKRDTKKLQNKIDELTAELEAARNAHAQAEHEAATLRDKLGRMLDCSHEITRIGGDC